MKFIGKLPVTCKSLIHSKQPFREPTDSAYIQYQIVSASRGVPLQMLQNFPTFDFFKTKKIWTSDNCQFNQCILNVYTELVQVQLY